LATVKRRNAETLEALISKYVKPGSKIYTDCWRGYAGLEGVTERSYTHLTVNHEVEYVTADGVNTNTIEGNKIYVEHIKQSDNKNIVFIGTWNGIKINISARYRTKETMPWMLVDFI
jgi:hypothetical protein